MRKVVCIFLSLFSILALLCTVSFASSADLSNMSLESSHDVLSLIPEAVMPGEEVEQTSGDISTIADEAPAYTPTIDFDINSIYLIPFDYELAKSGKVEEVCYPSGLQLPTKYCDMLDYIPYTDGTFSDEAAIVLNTLHPECANRFTYPEYMAAKRFVFLIKASNIADDAAGYRVIFSDIMNDCNWSLLENFSDITLNDTTRFCNALQIYQELLQDIAEGGEVVANPLWELLLGELAGGFHLTIGSSSLYDLDPADCVETVLPSGITFMQCLEHLPEYWNYLSCTATPTTYYAGIVDGVIVVQDELVDNSSIAPIGVEHTGDSDEDIDDNVETDVVHNVVVPPVREPIDYTKGSGTVNVDTTQNGIMDVHRSYNLRDIASMFALIFATTAIITLWIISIIRKKKDPLYRWLR